MRYATSSRKRERLHDQLRREVEARKATRNLIVPIQVKEVRNEQRR